MIFRLDGTGDLLCGPLLAKAGGLPLTVTAILPDLRPRFIAKGKAGGGHRAIARNGRVLLASDRPLAGLTGQAARVRFQIWHRSILPGDPPAPYGVLMAVRLAEQAAAKDCLRAQLVEAPSPGATLALTVGGGQILDFTAP